MLFRGTLRLSTCESQRRKEQGDSRELESQKFSHETGRRLSGVALSVMKYAWGGSAIRIRGAMLHFRDGTSQTESEIDAMAYMTSTQALKARPRLV
jgi:hypothetical protein